MSRQSSLAEDRISSDEDEFQEERTGKFEFHANGLYSRAHSPPTPAHIVQLSCPMDRQICTSSSSVSTSSREDGSSGEAATAPGYCLTKRVPFEPDLIRDIMSITLPNKSVPDISHAGGHLTRNQDTGNNARSPSDVSESHVSRETQPCPTLQRKCLQVDKGARNGKKRKKFKLRTCLIRSCISH